jgi:glycosyltransferase involved in cell wall biosynthesis
MKKKLLIISPLLLEPATIRGGGIEEIDYQISLGLSSKFEVTIVGPYYQKFKKPYTIKKNLILDYVHFPAIKYYPPRSSKEKYQVFFLLTPLYTLLFVLKLSILLIQKEPTHIIVHNGLPGLFGTILSRIMKKTVFFSEGNLAPWTSPYIYPIKKTFPQKFIHIHDIIIGKIIAHFSNKIRVQSSSIKKGMTLLGIPEKKITIIEGGVDTNQFNPIYNQRNNEYFTVGFVGRLSEEKGGLLLIDIIKKAEIKIPNVKFKIFGDGHLRKYLQDYKNIEHIGYIPKNELNSYLSTVLVVMFFQNDLGLAELEALASGKIIMVSNLGEIPKIINHLKNGVLCEPSVNSYIENIKILQKQPDIMIDISKNARLTAINEFSWPVITQKWEHLLINCR